MELKKAISHLQKKIGHSKYSSQYDRDCMNEVIRFYNSTQDKQTLDQELFAKLFIFLYGLLLEKYETTVFDNSIQKKLCAILERTPAQLIERLKNKMNESEMYQMFDMHDRKDFAMVHLEHIKNYYIESGMTEAKAQKITNTIEEKRKKSTDGIIDFLEDNPKLLDYLKSGKDIWKFDTVSENICAMINEAIRKYSPPHLVMV